VKTVAGLILCASLLGACGGDRSSSKDTLKQVSSQVDELTRSIGDFVTRSEVPEEFKKLQQFEYKIVSLPAAISGIDLETELNKLGKERWDCFHFEKRLSGEISELEAFCKRRPDTPLKYVPKTFIGGG